jgi:DNA repair exonuclease SbcCD ATPase subunit
MSGKLHVSHVRISNILGIEELEFAPGGFTEIVGANGSGKTSTIEALRSALRGGHDCTLLRKGAEKGEVVLVLDDGSQITKTITPDGTKVNVLRDERKLSRPAEAIKALHDVLSVNPVEFLRAPEKARVDALLQVMPITVNEERLEQIAGDLVQPGTGLDQIEATKVAVFDERTAINRTSRDKDGAIKQLRATLPDHVPESPETDATLVEQLNAIDATRDRELEAIGGAFDVVCLSSHAEIDVLRGRIDEIEAEARRQVEAVKGEIEAERAALAEVRAKSDAERSAVRERHAAARAEIQSRLDGIKAAHEQQARYALTTENISRMADELDGLQAQSHGLTEALDALDAYKAELLASLPIPGLEVVEGRLQRYGIPFDRLNTAQQVEIAVEIAKLRAGELGLICVDGLELLDEEHYEAFRQAAAASGLQLIVSRVGSGALEVRTAQEAATA